MKKNIYKKIKDNLFNPQKPYWIFTSLIFMGLALLGLQQKDQKSPEHSPSQENQNSQNIDTMVPNGYVLVALQLINSDSINALLGPFGMVDLYPTSATLSWSQKNEFAVKKSATPLATHLRIIRAPNNPRLFGVLLPETSRELILQLAEPVFAVIHHPNASSQNNKSEENPTSKLSHPDPKQRIINYGE